MGTLDYTDSSGIAKTSAYIAVQQPDMPYVEPGSTADYYSAIRNALGSVSKNFALSSEGFDNLWKNIDDIRANPAILDSSIGKTGLTNGYIKFIDGTLIQYGGFEGPATSCEFVLPFVNTEYTAICTTYTPIGEFSCTITNKTPTGLSVKFVGVPTCVESTVGVNLAVTMPGVAGQGTASGQVPITRVSYPTDVAYAAQWIAIGAWK